MRPDTDIAILGAGCAGLSLAAALAIARVPGHAMLLDARSTYIRDRTWCFWNTEEHPFTPAISHSWSSWRVSHDGQEALQHSRRYRYCHIASDDFYRLATDRIARAGNQELCLDVAVHATEAHPSGLVAIETSRGRLLARQVFDGRTPDGIAEGVKISAPALLQRFTGWYVRTSNPCFNSETVDLMRFLPSDVAGRTRFLYLLPFSTTEALVEMTYLDDPRLLEPDYKHDLNEWLSQQTREWEILYTERGALPMQTIQRRAAEEHPCHRHPWGAPQALIRLRLFTHSAPQPSYGSSSVEWPPCSPCCGIAPIPAYGRDIPSCAPTYAHLWPRPFPAHVLENFT